MSISGMALVASDATAARGVLEEAGETVFDIDALETAEGAASVRIDLPPGWLS